MKVSRKLRKSGNQKINSALSYRDQFHPLFLKFLDFLLQVAITQSSLLTFLDDVYPSELNEVSYLPLSSFLKQKTLFESA